MRIAYFTNTYPRATDTFIRHEVIGLRKRGVDVVTYSVRKSNDEHNVDDEIIREKQSTKYILPVNVLSLLILNLVTIVKYPVRYATSLYLAISTARPGIKGHILQLIYFLEAIILMKYVKNDNVTHIHNHLGDTSGTVTLIAAKLADLPYSITVHGSYIFFDGFNWALDKKTEYSKFISCIGHYCTSQMMLFSNKKDWGKFKIIRCGVDLKQFRYNPPQKRVKDILYVGRLGAEKGLPILFESLALLKDQNYNIQLTLLGDGEDREFLENLAIKLGIDEKVVFGGFVGKSVIVKTLQCSDVFVLPSFAEGIPVALMEAMAVGTPVIATYVGGVTELVVDGHTGQVVYPSDVEGLSKAIARYVDMPDFCKKVSFNARKKVEEEFNIEDQIDKLAELFSINKL